MNAIEEQIAGILKRGLPFLSDTAAQLGAMDVARTLDLLETARFVDQVARSARLYQRGLLTAKEFTDVTVSDIHRLTAVGESNE